MMRTLLCGLIITCCCTLVLPADPVWPPDTSLTRRLHDQDVLNDPAFAHNTIVRVAALGADGAMSFSAFLSDLGTRDSVTYLIAKSATPYVVGCKTINIGGWSQSSKRTCIAVRGETGNRQDIVLAGADPSLDPDFWKTSEYGGPSSCGAGKTFEIVCADHITFADMTLRNFAGKTIAIDGGLDNGVPYCGEHIVLHNLDIWDCGSQLVKAAGAPVSSRDCILECSKVHYTDGLFVESNYQTQGIDVHRGRSWTVRYNFFLNCRMRAGTGSWGSAVLFWDNSDSALIEGNLIVNCDFALVLGLGDNDTTDYMTAVNNVIVYDDNSGKWKPDDIVATKTPFTVHGGVYHNTIYSLYNNASVAVCNSALPIRNNLYINGATNRCGSFSSNLLASASWFVNPFTYDFHLTANHTVPSAGVSKDILGRARADPPSAGAYEYATSNAVKPFAGRDRQGIVSFAKYSIRAGGGEIYDLRGRRIQTATSRLFFSPRGVICYTEPAGSGAQTAGIRFVFQKQFRD